MASGTMSIPARNHSGTSSPTREGRNRSITSSKKLLKEVLELERVRIKDGSFRYTIKPVEETLSFDKGFYVFVRALQLLKSQNDGVILVGLGGASGSGKSAFSEKIKAFMPGVVVISMDMYNDGSKVVDQNFDDPRLTDYDCLLANLADLRCGKATDVPIYDFKQSKRIGYKHEPVPSGRVVILEGIYALNEKLRPMMDLRVSITGGVHFDLVKRVMRDITRSGQGPEAIIQQVTETVYPMYKAFIEPDLQTAQLRIHNSFNPFSGFMHPTYILKSNKQPPVELIRTQLQALGQVVEAEDKDLADIYLLPPGEDPETCQTWLRMRNKEGRYSLMFEEWVTEEPFIISPRITFEVSVKILGGLMALGYEIGTIMKRTSHIFKVAEADMCVKLDQVDNLGHFVQLLGRERQRVAELGRALGLEGTYIPRSYIEQVQLDQLTSDFTAVTAEMRDRLTSTGTNSQMLHEILNASPPARIPRRSHAGGDRRTGPGPDSLSSSAPVEAPLHHMLAPSPSQITSALTGMESRTSSITQQPSNNNFRQGSGLLHQQHSSGSQGLAAAPSPTPHAVPTPRTQQAGFSPAPQASLLTSALSRDMPQTPVGRRTTNGHSQLLLTPGGEARGPGANGNGSENGLARADHLSRAVDQLDGKLQRISSAVSQYSDMKVQLDAMVEQYQATNQQLLQLTQTTAALQDSLQATLAAVAAQEADRQQASSTRAAAAAPTTFTDQLVGLYLPMGVALVAGAAVSFMLMRASSRSS